MQGNFGIRIIEDSDNQGSDNRGFTVQDLNTSTVDDVNLRTTVIQHSLKLSACPPVLYLRAWKCKRTGVLFRWYGRTTDTSTGVRTGVVR